MPSRPTHTLKCIRSFVRFVSSRLFIKEYQLNKSCKIPYTLIECVCILSINIDREESCGQCPLARSREEKEELEVCDKFRRPSGRTKSICSGLLGTYESLREVLLSHEESEMIES